MRAPGYFLSLIWNASLGLGPEYPRYVKLSTGYVALQFELGIKDILMVDLQNAIYQMLKVFCAI